MPLDPALLKTRAREQTGFENYGDAPLDDGLEAMCYSLATEARLTPEGIAGAEKLVVETLIERLKIEDWLQRHPQVLEQDVAPILLVIGMPRNGTTALAQHLSEDPRARSIPRWESTNITPPPAGSYQGEDPRIEEARRAFAARDAGMPWRRAILPVAYDDPAEHGVLMALTFRNLHMPTLYRVPSYERWLLAADLTPAYEYFARVLKLLQSRKSVQYWNLKHPPDLFGLDAIEKVFPGTQYVWTHRNPLESLSSSCSLCAALREKQGRAEIDKSEIGSTQLTFQFEGARRAMAARDRMDESRFFDVYQTDLSHDLVGAIRGLYNRLGMEFTDAYSEHLALRMTEKPRGRHGKHSYSMAEFGVGKETVLATFKPYIDRFNISVAE
jgi:hypothetical protein